MKQLIFLISFTLTTFFCRSQTIDWSTTRNWKIYALNTKAAYSYPVDTLSNFKNVRMNDSAVISFLTKSVIWPKGKGATWMGLYISSYEAADKKLRKIVISSYGGFLFEQDSRRYYELPENLRQSWNDFLINNLQKVFEE